MLRLVENRRPNNQGIPSGCHHDLGTHPDGMRVAYFPRLSTNRCIPDGMRGLKWIAYSTNRCIPDGMRDVQKSRYKRLTAPCVLWYLCLSTTGIFYDATNDKKHGMIAKPIKVKALEKHTIFVEFSDGTRGAVDLAHLAHKGVFRDWEKNNLFAKVHVDANGVIAWNENIDICNDNVWLRLKGMTFEQWRQKRVFMPQINNFFGTINCNKG